MVLVPPPKVLVVGAGAIGLRTALEFIKRKVPVVLQAPVHPLHPSTCSMGAGGLWMPFHVNDPRTEKWAAQTLQELLPFANDPESDLVEIVPAVMLMRDHGGPNVQDFTDNVYDAKSQGAGRVQQTPNDKIPSWAADDRLQFQHLTVEMLAWQNIVNKLRIPPESEMLEAGYKHAYFFQPPIVNCPAMLTHLLNEVEKGAQEINVETGIKYESVEHMRETAKSFGCNVVVNCSGLGAREACNDDELVGARGILLNLDRATCQRRAEITASAYGGDNVNDAVIMVEEEPWGSETYPCYLIPRGDKIVVGGSYLEGDGETGIRENERERLLENAAKLGVDMDKSTIVNEWTGFRPFRSTVKCEIDETVLSDDEPTVIHSYGYGGSGWTLNVGAARECADMLLGPRKD